MTRKLLTNKGLQERKTTFVKTKNNVVHPFHNLYTAINLFGIGIAWGFPFRKARCLKAFAIAFEPGSSSLLAESEQHLDNLSV